MWFFWHRNVGLSMGIMKTWILQCSYLKDNKNVHVSLVYNKKVRYEPFSGQTIPLWRWEIRVLEIEGKQNVKYVRLGLQKSGIWDIGRG